ncbi:NAD(P)H-dependent flavin oxidoreductase [Bradyrhizobium sp. SYSU BS000235]|uniref:NAD(P)H-dependent flavin oxidoreductase n=1 Tax=Bradyrhizobium sp. SYSU BS000235 TaxID=3411332 RepID=UPI003C74DF65
MSSYPRPITELFGIEVPIIQAPMLGIVTAEMVIRVAEAGGLGSISASHLGAEDARNLFSKIRQRTSKPINVNFLCHESPEGNPACEDAWVQRLASYYAEFGVAFDPGPFRSPIPTFGSAHCALLEDIKPKVVSFHFGLPPEPLLERVRNTGAKIVSSATTVEEAQWLEEAGCNAIIAQGLEAGGHRGTFLHHKVDAQVGTMALVPQVVDAVKVPVIAAGGIGDPRGVAAAFALGASAVQVGTAFLFCEEANVSPLYRQAIAVSRPEQTVVTNIFTGRPARVRETRIVRELGPMAENVPAFPLAAAPLAPLRAASEPQGCADFMPLWCGQAARLSRQLSAAELTRWLSTPNRPQ